MADNKRKTPIYLIDTQSDFYRPLGLRLGICISTAAWAGLEAWHRQPFWSVIAIACAIYCTYVLLLTYKAPEPVAPRPPDPEDDEEQPGDGDARS